MSVDPVYKVARSGARVEEMRWTDRTVIDGIFGYRRLQEYTRREHLKLHQGAHQELHEFTRWLAPSPGLADCPKGPTGSRLSGIHRRYSLGIACALYEADHVVSIINPAQIRDFVRTKLGRNKTDGVDASHIREYCELFKPSPWAPPSQAHRRLGELQTIRSGIIAGLTEWKNRKNS